MGSLEANTGKINFKQLINSKIDSFQDILAGLDIVDPNQAFTFDDRKLMMSTISRIDPTREELSLLRTKITGIVNMLFEEKKDFSYWHFLFTSLGKYDQNKWDGVEFDEPVD